MYRLFAVLILALSLYSCGPEVQSENPIVAKNKSQETGMMFPKPVGYVNDFSGLFDKEQRSQLEAILNDFEKKTTNEIVVVTIDSITPYDDIHLYTTELANTWGVGKKELNNGMAVLICNNIKAISISIGYGTEKVISDRMCKIAIDSTMIPAFRDGNFYEGTKMGVEELIEKWR